MFQINVINLLIEIHFHYLVEQIGLIHYSHPSVVTEPPFSHCPPHLQYMLHGSRLLKQVHDVQRRLVDLHEQRIFGAFPMMLVLVCDDWHKCFILKLEAKFVWTAESTPCHHL